MPGYYPIQQSFSAGEITPRLRAQIESPAYQRGLTECHNFIALSQGPAARRPAFRFIGDMADVAAIDPTLNVRVIPFDINENITFLLLLSDLRMDVWTLLGPATGDNAIVDGGFFEALTAWIVDTLSPGRATYNSAARKAELNASLSGTAEAAIEQPVVILNVGAHTFTGNFINAIPGSGALCRIMVGSAQGLADFLDVTTDTDNVFSAVTAVLPVATAWVRIEVLTGSGHFLVDDLRLLDPLGPGVVSFVTPWGADDLQAIQWDVPANENTVFLVHEEHPPQEVLLDLTTAVFTFQTIVFIGQPAEWVPTNFPSTVTFFQGRSWFASTPAQPESIWSSKSIVGSANDYRDLTQGPLADDGIAWRLNRRGRIQWMAGLKALLVSTEIEENILIAENGILKTGDIQVEQQSAFGSSDTQGVPIGDQVLFLSSDRTKLRAEFFRWIEQGWVAMDITFASEHLLKEFGARGKEMVYARDPEQLIWIVREDGTMACSTYERSLEIIGWHQHAFGETGPELPADEQTLLRQREFPAQVVSIASGNFQGLDMVFGLVRRIIDGVPKIYLEELDLTRRVFQESWISRQFATPTNIVDGLDSLEGEAVQVLVDGAVDPDNVVVGGQITTQLAGITFLVGLRAACRIEGLPRTGGSKAGTSQGTMKRNVFIYARVLTSIPPMINGVRAPDRTPATPMDTPEPGRTTDIRVLDRGWDLEAVVTVSEDTPRDVQVLGWFGKVEVAPL
jgi:hypothetical protein